MATLWNTITGNSSLSVQPGNTLWDHLNNQNTGSGTVLQVNGFIVEIEPEYIIDLDLSGDVIVLEDI